MMAESTTVGIRCFWPLRGVVDLALNPRMTLAGLVASGLANAIFLVVAIVGLFWYWPWRDGVLEVAHLAQWGMLLAATFVVLVPLIRGRAGRAIIHPILVLCGRPPITRRRSLRDTFAHVLRTLPIRGMWILSAIGGAFIAPGLGVLVAACGIGHVTVLDAMDHALVACECPPEQRRDLRQMLLWECLCAGFLAGAAFIFASISVLGLLLWLPAIFAGAARRAHALVPIPAPPASPSE